jgi:beta-lactamase regulating signal transducer with metallopeptidase domain
MPAIPLDLLLKSVIVLALASLIGGALVRSSASLRAMVWTVALGSLLALPVLSTLLPSVPVEVLRPETSISAAPPAGSDLSIAPIPTSDFAPEVAVAPPEPQPGLIAAAPPASVPANPGWSWLTLAIFLWAMGSLLLLARIGVSNIRLARLARQADPIEGGDWTAIVEEVRAQLGIRRTVAVRQTDAIQVPAVAGTFRPVLLLPADADRWSTPERRDVVVHELAHVARWDALAQMICQLSCAVYWFIPVAWYGARRASLLREKACDDVVLNTGSRASVYAGNLLRLARQASGFELGPAALAMARSSRMEERVMGILDPKARRNRVTGRAAVTILVLAGGVIGMVAALEPVRRGAVANLSENVYTPVPPEAEQSVITPPGVAVTTARRSEVQDTTGFCGRGVKSSSSSVSEDNDERKWRVKIEGTDCMVDMRAEGKIEFNDDFTDIASISGGGFFTLDVTDRGVRRQLDIRSRNGSLEHSWKVNGEERPYDAEARAWFGTFLIELDRRTAVGVDIRLPAILARGGVNAVLDETALIPSDYARSRYYSGLLARTRLSSDQLIRLLDQAATLTESDFYATELLKGIGRDGLDDPAERAAVLKMLGNMDSDFYRSEVMKSLLAAGRPGGNEMGVLLDVVKIMESDFYQAEILGALLKTGQVEPAQRALVVRAAANMDNGFYSAEVLKQVASGARLTEGERREFLAAVANMESDFHIHEILKTLLRDGAASAEEVDLILATVGNIESDYYQGEVLGDVLDGSSLSEAVLLRVVQQARTIDSEFHRSETLRKVVSNGGANDRVRQAVVDAAETLGRHHREEVRRAAGTI